MKKKRLIFDGYIATIDLDEADIIDGYIRFLVRIKNDNANYKVYTGILDCDMNFIVPLRKEIVSNEACNEGYYSNHALLYPNKRCFYLDKDGCYLLDLNNISFSKKNDLYVPNNYIIKCDDIYDIGNGKVIILNRNEKGNDYIYDVVNNYISSNLYDVIVPSKKYPGMYDAYLFFNDNENFSMEAKLLIDDCFDIEDEVEINGIIAACYPYYVLADNDLLKEDDRKLCKRIKH